MSGTSKEKRLASQFIARFFKHFPSHGEEAVEALVDLCEDEDLAVSVCDKTGLIVSSWCLAALLG